MARKTIEILKVPLNTYDIFICTQIQKIDLIKCI